MKLFHCNRHIIQTRIERVKTCTTLFKSEGYAYHTLRSPMTMEQFNLELKNPKSNWIIYCNKYYMKRRMVKKEDIIYIICIYLRDYVLFFSSCIDNFWSRLEIQLHTAYLDRIWIKLWMLTIYIVYSKRKKTVGFAKNDLFACCRCYEECS